jgi:hypothetical protein
MKPTSSQSQGRKRAACEHIHIWSRTVLGKFDCAMSDAFQIYSHSPGHCGRVWPAVSAVAWPPALLQHERYRSIGSIDQRIWNPVDISLLWAIYCNRSSQQPRPPTSSGCFSTTTARCALCAVPPVIQRAAVPCSSSAATFGIGALIVKSFAGLWSDVGVSSSHPAAG